MEPRRSTGFDENVKALILARSFGNCEIMMDRVCQLTATTIHHRRPRGMGGTRREATNYADNGLAACGACHHIVETRREWAYENGFLVRQADDPASVAVWWRQTTVRLQGRRVKKMVLLDKGGRMREVGYGSPEIEP